MTNKKLIDFIKGINFSLIHERGGITFHPLACPGLYKIFSKGIEKVIPGEDYDPMLVVYHNGKTIVFMPADKFKSIGVKALSMLKKDPKIIRKYRARLEKQSKKFLDYMKRISNKFAKSSDEELLNYYREYVKQYYDCCILGEPFPFAVQHELEKYLEGILKLKIKSNDRVRDYYITLITPTLASFINREEMMLNRIVKKIKDNKKYCRLFKNKSKLILENLDDFPELSKMIHKHQADFFWVPHDYVGRVWRTNDIIEKIVLSLGKKKLLLKEEDCIRKLKTRQNRLFQHLIKNKIITNKEKELFIAAQDAVTLLDFKKEKLTQAHYYINQLFRIIAKRKKVDFWNLIFLMETELEDFLKGRISEDMLKNRRKSCTYVCTNYNVYCLDSNDTKYVLDYCLKRHAKESMEIHGRCASPGNLIARARVLKSPKDISKVKHGEIVVAGMTTPEYVPAMKKAAAIVTDEGGITCHAAIVSRELGIPCIIGTKIATKVLKDGDLVEVDANNGVVRKL